MNGVYFLSDYQDFLKEVAQSIFIPENQILSYQKSSEDYVIHDWVCRNFKNKGIAALILPISIPIDETANLNGLNLATHIRLNYELSIEERCIPIVFLSDFSLEVLISNYNFGTDNNLQHLFLTKGAYRSTFDHEDILKSLAKTEPLSKEHYFNDFLKKIKINQKAGDGKHSIANAWGCFRLAQVAGLKDVVFENPTTSSYLKTLHAKYLISQNNTFHEKKMVDLDSLNCSGKKILLIDDQSDEGWAVLMKGIFATAKDGFVCIDSGKYKNKETKKFFDFDGFYKECLACVEQDWDLIIIDLRLNPEKEDIDGAYIQPTEFSGFRLIDEFLKKNEGNQIIVSTASNKIWNINAPLKRGVSSYYIKESPEYNSSTKETREQFDVFKSNVKNCFKRKFLRNIFKNWLVVREEISSSDIDYIRESNTLLDIAWKLIKDEQLDFAFLTLTQILENFSNKAYNYKTNSIYVSGNIISMIEGPERGKETWRLTFNRDKINGDYFSSVDEQKESGITPQNLYKSSCVLKFIFRKGDACLKDFGRLNELRNRIAHNGAKNFVNHNDILKIIEILYLTRKMV